MAYSSALLGLGIFLDVVVFLTTLSITATSYRLYRLFRKPRYLQFSIGFLLVSIGYFFLAVTDLLIYPEVLSGEWALLLAAVTTQFWFASVLAGLLVLACLYYEVNERALQLLLAAFVIAAFLLGGASWLAFFVLSGVLFLFIALRVYRHYRANPSQSGLFLLIGFSLLLLAKLFSAALFLHGGLYLGYYIFKLAGVGLIVRSLWVISQ